MKLRASAVGWVSFLSFSIAGATTASAQTSILTIPGNAQPESFGACAVDIGDVDGDLVGDLAICATHVNEERGEIRVHSGANGAFLYAAPHPNPAEGGYHYGQTIAALGDVDLDGIPDFTATKISPPGGHVRVHSGATGLVVRDFHLGNPYEFGHSVDGIGDIDGDGAADVLVGDLHAIPPGGSAASGGVYCISGNTGAVIHTLFPPPGQASSFASSISSVQDVDGDQVPDVIGSSRGVGARVNVFSGASGAWLYSLPPASGSHSNFMVDGGGDLDGDGRGDFVVGDDSTTPYVMRVVSGATGAVIRVHPNECTSTLQSWVVTMLGDVDNDGKADYSAVERSIKRMRVYSGASGQVIWDLARGDLWNASPTYDRDGDGRDDVVLGLSSATQPSGGGLLWVGQVQIAVDDVEPVASTPSALGDGSGAPCPCGNTGTPGAGCAHSGGIGATAVAYGSTSLVEKTFHLTTTGIQVPRLGLLFRGTAEVNGGFGVPAGDGLRGAGGTIKRLGYRQVCSDPFEWRPFSLFPSTWIAGQTYLLQVWYRDNGGPCGTNFNMTNAVRIQTTP